MYITGAKRLAALNSLGTSVVEALAAGDGELPDGDGESAGDGELPAGDGELPAGDGLSSDGEGLPAKAHTLSAVAEPALLSTSVVALHVVQLVHDN